CAPRRSIAWCVTQRMGECHPEALHGSAVTAGRRWEETGGWGTAPESDPRTLSRSSSIARATLLLRLRRARAVDEWQRPECAPRDASTRAARAHRSDARA